MRAGEHHVRIRTDEADELRRQRALYQDHLVEDPATPDDFGLNIAPPLGEGPRPLPQLLHGRAALLRSRSLPRLRRLLDGRLGLLASPAEGTITLGYTSAVVGPRGAALVPRLLVERSSAVERRLAGRGVAIVDSDLTRVDLARSEVVVGQGLASPAAGADPFGADGLRASPGRYPVVAVYIADNEMVPDERRSTALVRLVRRATQDGAPGGDLTELLSALVPLASLCDLEGLGTNPTAFDRVIDRVLG